MNFEIHFERWKNYGDFECFPTITYEVGLQICQELERCEPFQNKSIYDDNRIRYGFMLAFYEEACKRAPIAMERAKTDLCAVSTIREH